MLYGTLPNEEYEDQARKVDDMQVAGFCPYRYPSCLLRSISSCSCTSYNQITQHVLVVYEHADT